MAWYPYAGADGKQYLYNPDTGQFIPNAHPGAPAPQAGGAPQAGSNPQAPAPRAPVDGYTPGSATLPTPAQMQDGNAFPTPGFSFGRLGATQRQYYNDPSHAELGWQKLTDYLNPTGANNNYSQWLNGMLGDERTRFFNSQAANPQNTQNDWVNYLEKLAPGLRDRFLSLSSGQRGVNPANYESGVYLG